MMAGFGLWHAALYLLLFVVSAGMSAAILLAPYVALRKRAKGKGLEYRYYARLPDLAGYGTGDFGHIWHRVIAAGRQGWAGVTMGSVSF